MTLPQKQGLYDPSYEHENCGIGLIVDMKGRRSHDIVQGALEICVNLDHRGGCGCALSRKKHQHGGSSHTYGAPVSGGTKPWATAPLGISKNAPSCYDNYNHFKGL